MYNKETIYPTKEYIDLFSKYERILPIQGVKAKYNVSSFGIITNDKKKDKPIKVTRTNEGYKLQLYLNNATKQDYEKVVDIMVLAGLYDENSKYIKLIEKYLLSAPAKKRYKNCRSNFVGVSSEPRNNNNTLAWKSNGKNAEGHQQHLGTYDTEREAVVAYDMHIIRNNQDRELNIPANTYLYVAKLWFEENGSNVQASLLDYTNTQEQTITQTALPCVNNKPIEHTAQYTNCPLYNITLPQLIQEIVNCVITTLQFNNMLTSTRVTV